MVHLSRVAAVRRLSPRFAVAVVARFSSLGLRLFARLTARLFSIAALRR